MAHEIIIPKIGKQEEMLRKAVATGMIPLRIDCPDCHKIYTLYIKDFNQGLHCLLGQACPFCKRFIRESDDPEKLVIDAKEIKEMMKVEQKRKN